MSHRMDRADEETLVRSVDTAVARLYLSCVRERDALIPFLFHSLFEDEAEIGRNLVDPLQRTTVEKFRRLIRYYQDHGYRFPPIQCSHLHHQHR